MAKQKNAPWMPPPYEFADATALQAIEKGTANSDQQQRALKWIVFTACKTYDMAYRPEEQRDTDFALGKQFVGQEIVKLLKLNVSELLRRKKDV